MTRPRFKTEVKLFVINQRKKGISWKKVAADVSEKFKVKAPSVRAMEKWEKGMDSEAIKAEMMLDAKGQMSRIADESQIQVGQKLLPVLLQARETGENVESAAWKWFFQWAETFVGKEKFRRLVEEYLAEQQAKTVAGR